jgi:hypothetical protein
MMETIYDILRSLNIEKNNFTNLAWIQEEWIDFINELEDNVKNDRKRTAEVKTSL